MSKVVSAKANGSLSRFAAESELSAESRYEYLMEENEVGWIALASNPSLCSDIQAILAASGGPEVRMALAGNICVTEAQQTYLAATGSLEVKSELAKNPALSIPVQFMLASDDNGQVRSSLAANRSLNAACQAILIDHFGNIRESYWDRQAIVVLASNPALTNELMMRLVGMNDPEVLAGLAGNPSLPESMMEQLVTSSNPDGNYGIPLFGHDDGSDREVVRLGLARNPSLPVALQMKLADDTSSVQEMLARSPTITEAIQSRLIQNGGNRVRMALAGNPCLAVAQQAQLGHLGDINLRLELFANPGVHERIKSRVIASLCPNDLKWAEVLGKKASAEWDRLRVEDDMRRPEADLTLRRRLDDARARYWKLAKLVDRLKAALEQQCILAELGGTKPRDGFSRPAGHVVPDLDEASYVLAADLR